MRNIMINNNLTNKQIHKELTERSRDYPEATEDDYKLKPVQVLRLPTQGNHFFTINCIPIRQAILKCADKFRSQKNFTTSQSRTPRESTGSATQACKVLIDEGDYQGAVDFWMLRHDAPHFGSFPVKAVAIAIPIPGATELKPGFVIGPAIRQSGWSVTHLDSGLRCGPSSATKAKAIKAFNAIPADKLNNAVERSIKGFQQDAQKEYGILTLTTQGNNITL